MGWGVYGVLGRYDFAAYDTHYCMTRRERDKGAREEMNRCSYVLVRHFSAAYDTHFASIF